MQKCAWMLSFKLQFYANFINHSSWNMQIWPFMLWYLLPSIEKKKLNYLGRCAIRKRVDGWVSDRCMQCRMLLNIFQLFFKQSRSTLISKLSRSTSHSHFFINYFNFNFFNEFAKSFKVLALQKTAFTVNFVIQAPYHKLKVECHISLLRKRRRRNYLTSTAPLLIKLCISCIASSVMIR